MGSIFTQIFHSFVPAVFFVVGLVVVIGSFDNRKRRKETFNWLATEGKVIKIEFNESQSGAGRPRYRGSIAYKPEVTYEYSVSERKYQNDSIEYNTEISCPSLERAQKQVSKYSEGSSVTVYYDPQDPEESVLVKGGHGDFLTMFVGIIIMCCATLGICKIWHLLFWAG